VIYNFTGGSDGGSPFAPLIQGSNGSLYGTTDAGGTAGQGVVFRISGGCLSLRVEPSALVPGAVGLVYSQSLAVSGGSPPYSYGVWGSLPPGLALDPVSGEISGTPTTAGSSTFVITATDHFGCSAGRTFTLTINAAAVHYYTIAPCRLVDTRPTSHAPFGGPPLGSNETRSWPWAGNCGLPADAVAVSANVTVPLPTADGSLVFYPAGLPVPETTTIYARLGKVRANNAQIAMNGPFPGVASVTSSIPGGTTNVIVDVNGYFK
jgi:uncharacterized repeat protein (TIGR03803 family)